VQNLRKPGGTGEASGSRFRPPVRGHTRRESGGTVVEEEENVSSLRDELKDAEAGLGRAKEEYRRLQNEVCLTLILCHYLLRILPKLTEATERIQALSSENEELLSLQRQGIAVHSERQQMLKVHKELEDATLENQRLLDKVNLISSLSTCLLILEIAGA
jgi:hypothetical protein